MVFLGGGEYVNKNTTQIVCMQRLSVLTTSSAISKGAVQVVTRGWQQQQAEALPHGPLK